MELRWMIQKQRPPKHQPHDRFVHECLSVDVLAAALLRRFCPAQWREIMAWEKIRSEKTDFKFASKYNVSGHLFDMLFFVPFSDGVAGGIHCHLEHYSKRKLPGAGTTAAYRDAFFADVRRKQQSNKRGISADPLLWQVILLQRTSPMQNKMQQPNLPADSTAHIHPDRKSVV